ERGENVVVVAVLKGGDSGVEALLPGGVRLDADAVHRCGAGGVLGGVERVERGGVVPVAAFRCLPGDERLHVAGVRRDPEAAEEREREVMRSADARRCWRRGSRFVVECGDEMPE